MKRIRLALAAGLIGIGASLAHAQTWYNDPTDQNLNSWYINQDSEANMIESNYLMATLNLGTGSTVEYSIIAPTTYPDAPTSVDDSQLINGWATYTYSTEEIEVSWYENSYSLYQEGSNYFFAPNVTVWFNSGTDYPYFGSESGDLPGNTGYWSS